MGLDPKSRNTAVIAASALAVLATVVAVLMAPDAASAALRSAAGGSSDGGGFGRFVESINRLADYTIPIGRCPARARRRRGPGARAWRCASPACAAGACA